MNRITYIITLFVLLLNLSACHDDLDIMQNSQLSASSMWTEQGDAESAMLGAHQRMRVAFSRGLVFWGEYRTGLWGAGTHGGLSQTERDRTYQNTMDNTHTYADWTELYTTINQANLVIKYTPEIAFTNENRKNEVLANAFFIRATCYYWIARIWGDAPLVLEGYESADQDLRPSRSSTLEILERVEHDIGQAASLMPQNITAKKTASLAAINMLKADFSLWMYKVREDGNQYLNDAAEAVDAVLNDTRYNLQNSYAAIFDSSSEGGSEVIYAWNYELEEYEGGYPTDYKFNSGAVSTRYHFNPIIVGTGQQWTFYTDHYIDVLTEYENDGRLQTNYQSFFDDGMNQQFSWTNKYKGSWVNSTLISDADIILYRLAEAYFFQAEIKFYQNDLSTAISTLNQVVKRAYGNDNFYTSLNQGNFISALVKERMKEFPAEGKLWWDCIRLGVVFDINPYLAGKENQQNILLWPISDKSINDNPNLGGQTPGWE